MRWMTQMSTGQGPFFHQKLLHRMRISFFLLLLEYMLLTSGFISHLSEEAGWMPDGEVICRNLQRFASGMSS